ncbi:hypothetical protein [Niallia circulans]|uniref:Uncharacterized protein n=1 Tax=Niallia circulans TaxID=1397 RepID=A0A941JML6_NIACI|nr:hypothetical protein [Niallia circulans]MCB5238576.1 hypothetical protein [Niallia circulans]
MWDEESIKDLLSRMLQPSDNAYYWVAREKQTENFIGLVSLDPITK